MGYDVEIHLWPTIDGRWSYDFTISVEGVNSGRGGGIVVSSSDAFEGVAAEVRYLLSNA